MNILPCTRHRLWSLKSRYYFLTQQRQQTNMPSALVLLAEGAEEMEAIITADVLRRGEIDVTIAGLAGTTPVKCSRNVVVTPDVGLDAVKNQKFDAIVCPGGMGGAKSLAASVAVGEMLQQQEKRDAYVACICAAPIALSSHKVGSGKRVTSHPVVQQDMVNAGYKYSEDRVVVDGKLVTSRGPGTAFEFALKLVELLASKDTKEKIIPGMLLPDAKY